VIGVTGREAETPDGGVRRGRPRVVAGVWLALLLLGVAAGGCGGCGSSSGGGGDPYAAWGGMSEEEWRKVNAEAKEKERREAAAAKAAEERRKAEEAAKKRRAQRNPGQASASPPSPAASPAVDSALPPPPVDTDLLPPLPQLPESVAEWQEGDLYIARVQGNPQLAVAVTHYGKQAVGDERAATVLSNLLPPPALTDWLESRPEPTPRPRSTRKNRGVDAKPAPTQLIEAIADALGANGSPKARETLGQMIAGTVPTEQDRTAAFAALKSLVDHPSLENEALLFEVLTKPDAVRPAGRGEVSADELRRKALELVRPHASRWLRRKVAEYIVAPSTSPADRDLLGQLTAEVCPENLEAHLILYRNYGVTGSLRLAIEQELARYSSDTLGCLLGVPALCEKALANPDWPRRVTDQLWSDLSVERICRGLEQVGTFKEDGSLVCLASTIPSDLVRHTLYKTLEKHWEDGPRPLRTTGLAREVFCEPGFLAVLKTVYRKESLAVRSEGNKYVPAGRTDKVAKLLRMRQKQTEELDGDWQQLSRELLQVLCGQFRATALAQARSTASSVRRPPFDPADFPLSLHSDQSEFGVYRFDWASAHQGVAGVPLDRLKIDYIRFEEKTRPVKVQGFYRRQLTACETHLQDDGVWLDSVTWDHESGCRRSVDVLITCVNSDIRRLADEEQKLAIDILCLEIRDPVEPAGSSGRGHGD